MAARAPSEETTATKQLTAWRPWRVLYPLGLVVADAFAAVLALGLTYLVRPSETNVRLDLLNWRISYKLLGFVLLGVWVIALAVSGAYKPRYPAGGLQEYRVRVVTATRLMALVVIASFVFHASISRVFVFVCFPTLAVAALLTHWVLRQVLARLRRGGLALNRLVLAGDAIAVMKLVDHFVRTPNHGYQVVGVCVPGGIFGHNLSLNIGGRKYPIVGNLDDLVEASALMEADSVAVVGNFHFEETSLQKIAWQLERRAVDVLVAPDVVDVAGPRVRFAPVTGMPLLQITEPRIYGASRWLKPCYERALSVPLLILASPTLLAVSVAILIGSGRPIFYRQRRIGLGGEEFEMLKFRTMVPGADKMLPDLLHDNDHDGALFKMRDDPRVTRVGRFLRRHSLDELPQLFNVLRGEMLLVGPRPCLPDETEGFGEAARRRFLARPGMTGLWQVSGRSDIPWEEAVRLDLYYVENWSLLMDLMIVWRTLRVVTGGDGGY